MSEDPSPRMLTFLAAVCLAAVSYLTMWDMSGPRIFAPYSFAGVAPALLGVGIVRSATLGDAAEIGALVAACLVVPTLFLLWCPHLLRGRAEVPKRSKLLLLITAGASFLLLAIGWPYAYEWQGAAYTFAMVTWNVAALVILVALLRKAMRRPTFVSNLAFHTVFFGWVAWCAFPWMGETL